jgi:hypothetical protein
MLKPMQKPKPADDEEKPLDPAAERALQRMRTMTSISSAIMAVGLMAVFLVIGYRVFYAPGSTATRGASEVTALLPKGSKVVSTAVAGDKLVVTVEVGGLVEVRTFDAATLQPAGRLRFAIEP